MKYTLRFCSSIATPAIILAITGLLVVCQVDFVLANVHPPSYAVDSTNNNVSIPDSVNLSQPDSLRSDTPTLASRLGIPIAKESEDVKTPLVYTAKDSIVYDLDAQMLYLYHNVHLDYDDIELDAERVEYDWQTSTLQAHSGIDSMGELVGKPVLNQGGKAYEAERMGYNLKSQRGKVYNVVTEENQGYIHADEVKKTEGEAWFGKNTRFTTCEHDEPHFYIGAEKVKMIPNQLLVTGPANLVIADVPTPLVLPFALIPTKQGRRSGIIFPTFQQSNQLGFSIENGGYYWAQGDHFSTALTGRIHSKGSWGVNVNTKYNYRYQFKGDLYFSYFRRRPSDPDLPNVFSTNDFSLKWSHTQDQKSWPNNNLSGTVNIKTSSFNRNSLVTDQSRLNTNLNSNIRYSKVFPGKPFNFSASAGHTQNLNTRIVTVDFPVVHFGISRINPFKAKVSTGEKKWFERLSVRYDLDGKSSLKTIDSTFFQRSSLDKVKYGLRHKATIDMPSKVFKYFTLTPSFNYTELWYFKELQKEWDPTTTYVYDDEGVAIDTIYGQVVADTLTRFTDGRHFNTRLSLSTTLYGIYKFKGKRLKGLRHEMRPNISFTYRPDFEEDRWGYYKEVVDDTGGVRETYSIFDAVSSVYGKPPAGQQGLISFGLNNNFEIKVYDKKDTVNQERKIRLLDRLSINSGYNLAVDTLKWQTTNISASTNIARLFNLTGGVTLDPYRADSNNRRLNEFLWDTDRKLFRLTRANFGVGLSLSSNGTQRKNRESDVATDEELELINNNPDGYYDFDNPWSFSVNYNFNYTKRALRSTSDIPPITQSINGRLDFNLTPKWKFDVSSGYDFRNKEPTLTNVTVIRDLHCWELKFNWTAYPVTLQQYNIEVRVKSAVLQDLKLSKKKNALDTQF